MVHAGVQPVIDAWKSDPELGKVLDLSFAVAHVRFGWHIPDLSHTKHQGLDLFELVDALRPHYQVVADPYEGEALVIPTPYFGASPIEVLLTCDILESVWYVERPSWEDSIVEDEFVARAMDYELSVACSSSLCRSSDMTRYFIFSNPMQVAHAVKKALDKVHVKLCEGGML